MTLTTVWCMSHLRCFGMAPTALALILVLGTVGARKRTRGLKGSSQVFPNAEPETCGSR